MSEWDRRELCPDGGCVGVIGKDGKCSVCGKESASGVRPPAPGEDKDEHEHEHDQEPEQASGQSPKPKAQSPSAPIGDEWDQRQLCSDGACLGVIEDGKCNVCGKAPE